MNQMSRRVKRKSDGEIKTTVDRIENRPAAADIQKRESTERISFHVSFSVFGSPINYSSARIPAQVDLNCSPPSLRPPLVFSSSLSLAPDYPSKKEAPPSDRFLRAIIS